MSNDGQPGKEILRWADESMFTAEEAQDTGGGDHRPRVRLLDAPSDPLGKLAFIAKAYQGKFPESYAAITDEDRRYYIQDMEKNILGMPSEAIQFHFVLENVTRSFTHQLVRTRHASYAQESMRFAVKEDFPVQLPPHLLGTLSREEWWYQEIVNRDTEDNPVEDFNGYTTWRAKLTEKHPTEIAEYEERYASPEQRARFVWDESINAAKDGYEKLIALGMPAEDARGLSPHAIVTKINWVVDLRALMATAGQRLCTQAQWEHREMWASLIQSIRDYGKTQFYTPSDAKPRLGESLHGGTKSSDWQFDLLADRFKPVCYQTGRCQFRSDFDRYCNIRDRVEANAKVGRPSSEWHEQAMVSEKNALSTELGFPMIPAIHPQEWLDPNAAIRPSGDWRSAEAQSNIAGRR